MLSSLQSYAIFFIGGIMSIIAPSALMILFMSDLSFIDILQYIYANKLTVLALAVLSSILSNIDNNRFFLLRENILPGAIIGLGIGFLMFQALVESS